MVQSGVMKTVSLTDWDLVEAKVRVNHLWVVGWPRGVLLLGCWGGRGRGSLVITFNGWVVVVGGLLTRMHTDGVKGGGPGRRRGEGYNI